MSIPAFGPAQLDQCTGCMACVDVCPHHALSSGLTRDCFRIPQRDPAKCTNCGLCDRICPIIQNTNFHSTQKSELYAGWDNNSESRKRSSSGGVFGALARVILQQGGHVYGAAIDGTEVKVLMIDRLEDLVKLQGSRYAHADYAGAYRAVKEDLKNKIPVLFSGLSCQVVALQNFLGNEKENPLLYTIDLVCTGVPSLLPMKMIERYCNGKVSVVSFRDKDNGWTPNYRLVVSTVAGKTQNYSSFYYRCYSTSKRKNCGQCPFAHLARMCDYTIGDFWGDKDFPQEHVGGISAVLVHTNHGRVLLAKTDVTFHHAQWQKCLPYNPRISDAEVSTFHERRFWKETAFRYIKAGYVFHFPPTMNSAIARFLWLPLRLMQKFQLRKDRADEISARATYLQKVKDNGQCC